MNTAIRAIGGIVALGLGLLIFALAAVGLVNGPENPKDISGGFIIIFLSAFFLLIAIVVVLKGISLILPEKVWHRFAAKFRAGLSEKEIVDRKTRQFKSTPVQYPLDYSVFKRPFSTLVKRTYRRWPTYYYAFVKIMMGVSVTITLFLILLYASDVYHNYYLILLPLVVILGTSITVAIEAHTSRIGRFAEENGFTFSAGGSYRLMSGTIFSGYGKSISVENVVDGVLPDGSHFNLFSYSFDAIPYDTGFKGIFRLRSTQSNTYRVTTISFTVTKKLPHIILDNKKNDLLGYSRLPLMHRRSSFDRLTLEGHFNDYYTLYYVSKGTRKVNKPLYVLSILSPDFMDWLINLSNAYDIEWVGNRVFIHAPFQSIQRGKTVEGLLGVAEKLEPRMKRALYNYRDNE